MSNDERDNLVADLDLVRALVRSWGNFDEGSAEQARAITNSREVLDRLIVRARMIAAEADRAAARHVGERETCGVANGTYFCMRPVDHDGLHRAAVRGHLYTFKDRYSPVRRMY